MKLRKNNSLNFLQANTFPKHQNSIKNIEILLLICIEINQIHILQLLLVEKY